MMSRKKQIVGVVKKRLTTDNPGETEAAKHSGAPETTIERKRREARERAEVRRIELAKFHAQYGEGHNSLENFVYEYGAFGSLDPTDPHDLDRLEELLEHVKTVAKAIQRYLDHETRTLDEAFKVRRPDGYRQPAERRKFLKIDPVQRDGRFLREHGAVIDDAFFEVLAERHGIKTTVAREYYYADPKLKGLKPKAGKSPDEVNSEYRRRLNWKA